MKSAVIPLIASAAVFVAAPACADDPLPSSNDGRYFHAMFAINRIRAEAPNHTDWNNRQPFKGILERDWDAAGACFKHPGVELLMESCSGMTTDQFEANVTKWLATTKHPQFNRRYTEIGNWLTTGLRSLESSAGNWIARPGVGLSST